MTLLIRPSREHPALVNLPKPYYWLVPELDEIEWPDETRADCSDCVMCPGPNDDPKEGRFFLPEVRCCGFHPALANFRVGKLLRSNSPGRSHLQAKLKAGDGVTADGIDQPTQWGRLNIWSQQIWFGRNIEYRCPYWVGGAKACGIWNFREGICRTWYCRHVEGIRSVALWNTLRYVLMWCDYHLAQWCVQSGSPPPADASINQYLSWFDWCAETIQLAREEQIAKLSGDELTKLRQNLRLRNDERGAEMPDYLLPTVRGMEDCQQGVRLFGSNRYDWVEVPREILHLFGMLDGDTRWKDAIARLDPQLHDTIDEALIDRLFTMGVLSEPDFENRQSVPKSSVKG